MRVISSRCTDIIIGGVTNTEFIYKNQYNRLLDRGTRNKIKLNNSNGVSRRTAYV